MNKRNNFTIETMDGYNEGETSSAYCPVCGRILNKKGKCSKCNGSGFWDAFFGENGLGGLLSGAGDVISSITGKGKVDTVQNIQYEAKSNTGMYIAIVGGIIVLAIVLIFAFKK